MSPQKNVCVCPTVRNLSGVIKPKEQLAGITLTLIATGPYLGLSHLRWRYAKFFLEGLTRTQ